MGQCRLLINTRHAMHHGARQLIIAGICPIGQRGNRPKNRTIAVGLRQLPLCECGSAAFFENGVAIFFEIGSAGAQHKVGEIKVKFVGRHIRTFGHKAHIAQGAGINNRRKIAAIYTIQFAAGAFIN